MACADCINHQIGSPEFLEQLAARQEPGALPLIGSLELTLRCNVRCKHCYILHPGATDGEMPGSEVKRILDMLAERGVLFLLLTGGEILARFDFRELYLYARRKGFVLALFTNATLVDEDTAQFLAANRPRRIETTVYGHTETTYEAVTGVKGSFRRFRRGVELMVQHGLPLRLKTILLKSNVHELDEMRAWAESLGLAFRWDWAINPKLDGSAAPLEERLPPEVVARLLGTGDAQREQFERMCHAAESSRHDGNLFQCGAGIKTFHVDPRGMMHPCMMWRSTPYDLRRGSVDGWMDHLGELRKRKVPADSGCTTCSYRQGCSNCAATSLLEKGKAGVPAEYFCAVNRSRDRLLRTPVSPMRFSMEQL